MNNGGQNANADKNRNSSPTSSLTSALPGDSDLTSSPSSSAHVNNASNDSAVFECSICFDVASEPVVTLCGHLYCWPCLFTWMQRAGNPCPCPVCKASVLESELVPLYSRSQNTDGRKRLGAEDAPPRPRPRAPPPTYEHGDGHSHDDHGSVGGGGVQVQFFGGPLGLGMFGIGPMMGFQAQWPPSSHALPRSRPRPTSAAHHDPHHPHGANSAEESRMARSSSEARRWPSVSFSLLCCLFPFYFDHFV